MVVLLGFPDGRAELATAAAVDLLAATPAGQRVVPWAPATVRTLRPADDPLEGVALFARGSFSAWMARDRLVPVGPGRYAADIALGAGEHTYKFADLAWGAAANFGGPVGGDGLTVGADSSNLRLTADAPATWRLALEAWDAADGGRVWLPAAAVVE
ncbi:MAG: hypothetical protein KC613_15630, partial [Myxococcales bacterium]|nr:hypothetical protein [Myxococcales bacterium]